MAATPDAHLDGMLPSCSLSTAAYGPSRGRCRCTSERSPPTVSQRTILHDGSNVRILSDLRYRETDDVMIATAPLLTAIRQSAGHRTDASK